MAPHIPGRVVLEDLMLILIIVSTSPSYVELFSHYNTMCPGHCHWHISTPLPPQLGLGVEELGLEEGNNVGIIIANS